MSRTADPRRKMYMERLGASYASVATAGLDQLDRCKDDDFRRVLLRYVTPVKGGNKRTKERYKYRMDDRRRKPPKKDVNVGRMIELAERAGRA